MQVISLSDILSGNSKTIEELSSKLRLDGWALVSTTNSISKAVKNYQKDIQQFFINTKQEDKILHTEFLGDHLELDGGVYGYNKTDGFKEGLRLLTGGHLKDLWIPPGCDKAVRHLVEILDSTMLALIKATAVPVFKKSIQELASYDIPFLKDIQETSLGLGPANFAMLDIVYYKNGNPNSTSEVSVASHYDPGLLSLNILSTEPGLQFQTHDGNWIDIPSNTENIGVLWTGEQAANITQNNIKPGWHRVIIPKGKFIPRLSIWIEICSGIQDLRVALPSLGNITMDVENMNLVNVEIEKKNNFNFGKLGVEEKKNQNSFNIGKLGVEEKKNQNNFDIGELVVEEKKKPMTKVPVKKGETLSEALRRASQQYGIPMTKSITYYCPVCLKRVGNLLSHFEKEHQGAVEEV